MTGLATIGIARRAGGALNVLSGHRAPSSAALWLLAALALASPAARAAEPGDFRQFRIVVGTTVGATFDSYARLVGRHIGRFLPGRPPVTVENMAGAGGLTAANYLYNLAPRDGSTIGMFARALPALPLLDRTGVQYDTMKLNWLGNPASETSVVWAWRTTPFLSFEDIQRREMIVPASGPGADSMLFPYVLNAILGTKFRVVPGYPGGPELFMAVERGEAEGIASTSWSNFTTVKKDWLTEGKARLLLQLGLRKEPAIPDTPLVLDKASNAEDRKLLELIFSRNELAYPVAAPPGVPADRVALLREALRKTFSDEAFLADARRENLPVDFVSGEETTRVLADIYATPPELIDRVRRAMKDGGR